MEVATTGSTTLQWAYCGQCGKLKEGPNVPGTTVPTEWCTCVPDYPKAHPMGWECPKCGKVYSPSAHSCGCSGYKSTI